MNHGISDNRIEPTAVVNTKVHIASDKNNLHQTKERSDHHMKINFDFENVTSFIIRRRKQAFEQKIASCILSSYESTIAK